MRKKNITISDIAAKTGYSKTTVSFAFNWPNRISAAAVEKIMACANELGYHGSGDPDASNRYKTICVLVPEMNPSGVVPVWARSVYAAYTVCSTRGIMLSMINQSRMDDPFFVKSSAVDAYMVFTKDVSELLMDNARRRGIPIVAVNIAEGLSEDDRRANAVACLNMLIDLIRDGSVSNPAPESAYELFEANR
jgi:DNA-binding LacI/PurR family transcriptional regulator